MNAIAASERAIDLLGRQESHVRNLPWSSITQISKQVPDFPPRTPVTLLPPAHGILRCQLGYRR